MMLLQLPVSKPGALTLSANRSTGSSLNKGCATFAGWSGAKELWESQNRLVNSLREKDILLKEVHHRVKNNIQIISSLLNLQARYVKDRQAREIIQDSRNRIESMALVHEKLFRSKDLEKIDMNSYIQELASFSLILIPKPRPGRFKINVAAVELGIDLPFLFSLIIK
jgi:two-component sensor histidine kinase